MRNCTIYVSKCQKDAIRQSQVGRRGETIAVYGVRHFTVPISPSYFDKQRGRKDPKTVRLHEVKYPAFFNCRSELSTTYRNPKIIRWSGFLSMRKEKTMQWASIYSTCPNRPQTRESFSPEWIDVCTLKTSNKTGPKSIVPAFCFFLEQKRRRKLITVYIAENGTEHCSFSSRKDGLLEPHRMLFIAEVAAKIKWCRKQPLL